MKHLYLLGAGRQRVGAERPDQQRPADRRHAARAVQLRAGAEQAVSAGAPNQAKPRSKLRLICAASMPARPMRSSVRAVGAKSPPARMTARQMTASITGVGTPAAAPSACIGISPTGTSSAMYLWLQEAGVPVAW